MIMMRPLTIVYDEFKLGLVELILVNCNEAKTTDGAMRFCCKNFNGTF